MSSSFSSQDAYRFSETDRKGMVFCVDITQRMEAGKQLEACRERLKALAAKQLFTASDIANILHAAGTSLEKSVGELEDRWEALETMLKDGRFDSKQVASMLHDTASYGLGDAIDAIMDHKPMLNRYVDNKVLLPTGVVGIVHNCEGRMRQSLEAMDEAETALKRLTKDFGMRGHRFGPKSLGHALHHAGPDLVEKVRVMEERWNEVTPLLKTDEIAWGLAKHIKDKDPQATRETLANIISEPDRISVPGTEISPGSLGSVIGHQELW